MKVWITKYALTRGIFQVEGEPHSDGWFKEKSKGMPVLYKPSDWHETYQGAFAYADDMRERKIDSLRKQLARMESLTFEENE